MAKALRYTAKGLALLWGGFWVFFVVATGLTPGDSLMSALAHGWPAFLFLIGALIALKWEIIGAIVLLVEGAAIAIVASMMFHGPNTNSTTIMLAGPPLIAGIILLASGAKTKCLTT